MVKLMRGRFSRLTASKKQSFTLIGVIALVLAVIVVSAVYSFTHRQSAQAAACQSNGTGGGNWSAVGSWQGCGGGIPQSTDTVTILNGDTVTQNSASVTVVDLTIDLGGTLTVSTTNAITVSGNWSNSGTFTAATGTVTFSSTATGKTLGGTMTGTSAFYNLTFNGAAGGWSNTSAMEITNNLAMTNGILSGTQNITVNGTVSASGGKITLTGGTFEQRIGANKNFGSAAGGNGDWTFYNLTFSNSDASSPFTITNTTNSYNAITVSSVLLVGKTGDAAGATTTLNAGASTWSLTGTGGDPFQLLASPAAVLTASTSIFYYSGNNPSGNTTIQSTTYSTLKFQTDTFVLEGATVFTNDLNAVTGSLDVTTSNYSLTIGGSFYGSGSLTPQNGTVTFNATGSGKGISLLGGTNFYNITFDGVGGGWTLSYNIYVINVLALTNGTLNASSKTITLAGTTGTPFTTGGTFTASTSTVSYTGANGSGNTIIRGVVYYNLTLNATDTFVLEAATTISNNLTITAGTLDTVTGQNYGLTIGGNYSNSGTFTSRSGTVTLNGSAAQALSGTMTTTSAFYNLTVTNASGTVASDCERTGWVAGVDFAAGATITNNYVITTAGAKIEYQSAATYTFANINWNGQATGTRVYFRNSAVTGTWLLNVSGTQTAVTYINVSRSNASGGSQIASNDGTNTDCGNTTNWLFGYSTGGTVYGTDESTPVASGPTVRVKVNGAGTYSAVANGSGVFSVTGITMVAGDALTVYLDTAGGITGATFTVSTGANMTGIDINQDRATTRCDNSCSLTSANINNWDKDDDTDIHAAAAVTTNVLTVDNDWKLKIAAHTYAPGAAVTTSPGGSNTYSGDVSIETGTTLNMAGNALSIGGSYGNSGTFTSTSNTTTFTDTGTGETLDGTLSGSSAFYNLIFNGSGGEWTPNAAVEVANDLTMTAGTLLGTQDVTVNGSVDGTSGTINLTGGTFEQRVGATGKNFSSMTTPAWTFSNLTFSNSGGSASSISVNSSNGQTVTISGVLSLGKAGDAAATSLSSGNTSRVWALTGTGGDPFQIIGAGTIANNANFTYSGNNAGGNTTIQAATYNRLTINNASETYVLEGDTTVNGTWANPASMYIQAGTLDTDSGSNYALTATNVYIGGTLNANASTLTLNGTSNTLFNKQSTFNQGTSTVLVTSASGTPTLNASSTTFHILTINAVATVINIQQFTGITTDNTAGNKLYIQSGVLNLPLNASIVPGTAGTLQIDSGGTFCVGGTVGATNATCDSGATANGAMTFPAFSTYTFDASSTVRYLADAAQTVDGDPTYGNLVLAPKLTASRVYTFESGKTPTINGDFTINPTAASAFGLTVNMAGNITVAAGKTTTITGTTSGTSLLDLRPVATDYALSTGFLNIATAGTLDATSTTSASLITLTSTSGTLWTQTGTFTITSATSTVVMSPDAAVTLTSGTIIFYNLTLSPTITAARTYTFGSGAITINGDFMINPTAASALALTVNMGADITVAPTGTTTITRTTSATSTLDTTATNYALTTGKINIATGGTLNSRSSTITLNATSGTLWTQVGTHTGFSTVIMNPDATVTLTSGTVYFRTLILSPTITLARTYTFGSGALTIYDDFTINPNAASALELTVNLGGATTVSASSANRTLTITRTGSATSNLNTTASNYALNLNSGGKINIATGGTLIANGSTITFNGSIFGGVTMFTNNGTFTAGTSTVVMNGDAVFTLTSGVITFYNLTLSPTITAARTYTFGAGALTINGDFMINPTASSALALTVNMGAAITVATTGTTTITRTSSATSVLDLRPATTDYNLTTGNLTIGTGGTLDGAAAASAISVAGNYTNNGTFTAGSSTVTLDGAGAQTLSGGMLTTNAFYNLTVTNASGTVASDCERTGWVAGVDFAAAATVTNNYVITTASAKIEYESAATYTFANINWNGQATGTRVYFRNSAVTGTWLLNVSGTQTAVTYINVSRSNASGGSGIAVTGSTSVDCGNNTNWAFNANPNAPSALGPAGLVGGGYTADNTPTPTFTLSDPDGADTVKYQIQIDDSADYASAVVDYTSALAAQGARTFTVGQAAGTGTYTTGIEGQTLTDGSYYWRVKAIDNSAAASGWSTANAGVAFIVDATVPGGPTGVGSSSHTTSTWSADNTIDATWTAATDGGSGLSGYSYIFDTTADTTPDATQDIATVTTITSGALADGSSHYFHIRAVDAVGNWGSAVHAGPYFIDTTAPTVPGTPATTSPTTDTTPTWTWTASTDTSSGLHATTPYTIEWSQDATFLVGVSTTTSTTNSYTHAVALAEGTWYARVKATDALSNNSANSANGSVLVDATGPTGPTDLTSSDHTASTWSTDTTVTMTWTAATDGGSGLSGYSYIFDTTADTTPDTTQDIATVTTVDSTALADGSSHYFHIRAVDAVGNWGTAVHAGPYFVDTTAPTVPGTPATTSPTTDTTPTWTWTASTDASSGLHATTPYTIWWSQDATFVTGVSTDTAATNTFTHSITLAEGTWYARAKAIDTLGNNSGYSANGSVLVDATGPTGPTDLTSSDHTASAWSTDTTVTMTWTAATDGGSGLSGYSYLFDTAADTTPDTTQDIGTVTTVDSTALADGSSHYFHIRAVDALGNWGTAVHSGPYLVDTTAPADPTNATSTDHTASAWSTDTTVTMTWTASTDSGSGLAGYSYIFDTTSNTTPDTTQDIALVTTVGSTALADGNSHYFHIRAVDALGNWGTAVHSGPYFVDTVVPSVIALSTTSPTTDSTPTWTWAASDALSGLSGSYTVQWSKDSIFVSGVSSSTASTTSFTHSTALTTSTWYLRVQATDSAGNQAYSTNGTVRIEAIKQAEVTITQQPSPPTTPSEEPAPNTDQKVDDKTGLVDLTITIASQNKPLVGAKVELRSTPRYASTDTEGRVAFNRVEPGQHELTVKYGRRIANSLILVGATTTDPTQTISVTFNNPSWYSNWPSWVGILTAFLLGLILSLWLRRRFHP